MEEHVTHWLLNFIEDILNYGVHFSEHLCVASVYLDYLYNWYVLSTNVIRDSSKDITCFVNIFYANVSGCGG